MKSAIARMSTKGQIVIPSSMREDIKPGDEMLLVKHQGKLVLKSAKMMTKTMKDDFKFAERVELAWQKYDRGEFKTATQEEFMRMVDNTLWPKGRQKNTGLKSEIPRKKTRRA